MNDNSSNQKNTRKPKISTPNTIDTRMHAFNVGIAKDYNPTMALWLAHLAFWAEKNLANNKHIHDGLVWCYDTLEALGDYFPYFSKSQIETMINNSVKEGLVITGNYNKTTYDRTVWYALSPKAYFYFQHLLDEKYVKRLFLSISEKSEMDFAEFGNGFPGFRMTIPDTDPDPDPDVCVTEQKTDVEHTQQENVLIENTEIIELFENKFGGREITIQKLFKNCQEYYKEKNVCVTRQKFLNWIKREKPENYEKIGVKPKTPPQNETEQERYNRIYCEKELEKERNNEGYVSQIFIKYPELRKKYS